MINYTIREVAVDHITVDYEDGSWAQIPIFGSLTKEQIQENIAAFAPRTDVYSSVENVPFTVGEQNTIQSVEEREQASQTASDSQLLTYSELRADSYPPVGEQLDALYWARNGDNTKQAEIDARIAAVKAEYPKDMTPITRGEYNAAIEAAAE